MSAEAYRIDVCACGSQENHAGYPKYAENQVRAHTMAEHAVCELQSSGAPGEYFVAVSLNDDTPLSTQVVMVPHPSDAS